MLGGSYFLGGYCVKLILKLLIFVEVGRYCVRFMSQILYRKGYGVNDMFLVCMVDRKGIQGEGEILDEIVFGVYFYFCDLYFFVVCWNVRMEIKFIVFLKEILQVEFIMQKSQILINLFLKVRVS